MLILASLLASATLILSEIHGSTFDEKVPLLPASANLVTGEIRGVVVDETGGPIPGVTVLVTRRQPPFKRRIVTGPTGEFRVSGLPLGWYQVEANLIELLNFKALYVALPEAEAVALKLVGRFDGDSGEITLREPWPYLIDLSRSDVWTRISSEDHLSSMPVERDLNSILNLAPGVVGGGQ